MGDVREQHDYHRVMAASLIQSVGRDGAIAWASENHWEGVLAQILNLPPPLGAEKPER